jgi:hypothetical protein
MSSAAWARRLLRYASRRHPAESTTKNPTVLFLRLLGIMALAACATACGVRTTSVPVDAGPAPSRLPCVVTKDSVITEGTPGVPVHIYLVCASELAPVERTAWIPEQRRTVDETQILQSLLDELQAEPSLSEREAGFSTAVQGPLVLSRPHRGDPAGTVRLSRQPEDLSPTALAQIVCTFAENSVPGKVVVLGGPGDYPPRGYRCDTQTKSHPDAPAPTVDPVS